MGLSREKEKRKSFRLRKAVEAKEKHNMGLPNILAGQRE